MPAGRATDCHDQRGHSTTNCDGDRYIDGCAFTHVYSSSNRDTEPGTDAYSNSSWDCDPSPDSCTASNGDPCTNIHAYARADTKLVTRGLVYLQG